VTGVARPGPCWTPASDAYHLAAAGPPWDSHGLKLCYQVQRAEHGVHLRLPAPPELIPRATNMLKLQLFAPISRPMTQATTRRTHATRVRREISDILEQLYAIEEALAVFNRKREGLELARASRDYDAMLLHVDRLGELLRELRNQHDTSRVAEPTS
jgi:hypothetical protein